MRQKLLTISTFEFLFLKEIRFMTEDSLHYLSFIIVNR